MSSRAWFALLGVVATLGLAEGIARIYGDRLCTDAPGAFYQADPRVGWTHVPGLRGIGFRCDGLPIPAVPVEAGPTGLLDPPRPFDKAPGVLRIVVTGGNGPEGLGVRPEARMARLLEEQLDPGATGLVEVVNAATGGWAIDNGLAWLRAEGFRYHPDVVVAVLDPASELASLAPALIAGADASVPRKPFLVLRDDRLESAPAPPGRPAPPPREARGPLAWSQLLRTLVGQPTHTGPPLAWATVEKPGDPALLDAEIGRVGPLASAILRAMREEAAASGATVLVVLAPRPGPTPPGGEASRARLTEIANEAGVPVVDLDRSFQLAETAELQPFFPGTPRWSGPGHVIAASAIANWVRAAGLNTSGDARVVPATPVWRALPAAVAARIWSARWNPLGRFVGASLLAATLAWMAGLGSRPVRDVAMVALGAAVIAVSTGTATALVALGLATTAYWALELPWRFRWVRRVLVAASILALAAGPALVASAGTPRERIEERLVLALGSGIVLLRVVAYVMDRSRSGSPLGFRDYLASVVYFPSLLLGPFETPAALAARATIPAAPDTPAALRGRLAAAVRGLAVLARGGLLLAIAPWFTASSLAVYLTGGVALSTPRLWLWLLAQWACVVALFVGLSDVGTGLSRLLGGVAVPAFAAPWRSVDPADFWRRWLVSFHAWLARAWYRPIAAPGIRRDLAVAVVFLLVAAWWARAAATALGVDAASLVSLRPYLCWAAIAAGSVLVTRRLPHAADRPAWMRAALLTATVVVGALGWAAFLMPPTVPARRLVVIALRLAGIG